MNKKYILLLFSLYFNNGITISTSPIETQILLYNALKETEVLEDLTRIQKSYLPFFVYLADEFSPEGASYIERNEEILSVNQDLDSLIKHYQETQTKIKNKMESNIERNRHFNLNTGYLFGYCSGLCAGLFIFGLCIIQET